MNEQNTIYQPSYTYYYTYPTKKIKRVTRTIEKYGSQGELIGREVITEDVEDIEVPDYTKPHQPVIPWYPQQPYVGDIPWAGDITWQSGTGSINYPNNCTITNTKSDLLTYTLSN
jgi:hypothetical protein